MKRKRPSGYSGAMQRCASCGGRYDASEVQQVRRLRESGVLILCNDCWRDVRAEVRRGRANLGALLEKIAGQLADGE